MSSQPNPKKKDLYYVVFIRLFLFWVSLNLAFQFGNTYEKNKINELEEKNRQLEEVLINYNNHKYRFKTEALNSYARVELERQRDEIFLNLGEWFSWTFKRGKD